MYSWANRFLSRKISRDLHAYDIAPYIVAARVSAVSRSRQNWIWFSPIMDPLTKWRLITEYNSVLFLITLSIPQQSHPHMTLDQWQDKRLSRRLQAKRLDHRKNWSYRDWLSSAKDLKVENRSLNILFTVYSSSNSTSTPMRIFSLL